MNIEIDNILDFWFDYSHHQAPLFNRSIWWEKNASFDKQIEVRFAHARQDAIDGKLNDWLKTPKGTLAYIILIDQFSRNLYRETPQMVQYDYLALTAAKHALSQQFDQSLRLTERVFLYLPFEHSEQISDQKKSLELFGKLLQDTPPDCKAIAEHYLFHAKEHYSIIEQFNRFPHRNLILNRSSTKAESDFLNNAILRKT